MGGGGPNQGSGAGGHDQSGHPNHHKHTPPGPPTSQPIPVPTSQPSSFHPIQLLLKQDAMNNYHLQPITRGIPSFPLATLGAGFNICLGLKAETQSPVMYQHPQTVDNTLIYVSIYISTKGDIKETILGTERTGYKVGLILSAGGGVFQLGPVYSILSREENGWNSLAINVESPALAGQATIFLKEKRSNTITLDASFNGNGNLWNGRVGNTYKLN